MPTPTPESTIGLLLDTITKVITYLISYLPLAIIVIIVGGAAWWFFVERKAKKIDRVELLKKKHMELCKSMKETAYPYMKDLYMLPINLNNLGTEKEYIKSQLTHKNGIYLGEITGFNIVNNLSNAKELERLNKKGMVSISEDKLQELRKECDTVHAKAGDMLYFIRYNQNISGGFLTPKKIESLLILTSNQMTKYGDEITGKVLVNGFGIEPFGVFNILSGSTSTMQTLITHIKIMAETDMLLGVFGDLRAMVSKAIDLDSTPEKVTKTFGALGQSLMPRRRKDE